MIRQLTRGDVPELLDALREIKLLSPYYSEYAADEEHVRWQIGRMIDTAGYITICEQDMKGFMLGAVGPSWFSTTVEANEMMLFVFEEYRRSTVAIRLVRAFEHEAKGYGANKINVGSSLGIVDAGVERMYEFLGYKKRGHGLTKDINYV